MEQYTSRAIDHLGIVAALCDQLNIVTIVDQLIVPDKRAKLTIGECVKLMIINGLGFSSRPLYLEAQFFSSRPVDRLLGRSLASQHITDDTLGRALDRLFEANCEMVFSHIATRAVDYFQVDTRFRSLDTTSMSVEGAYENGMGLVTFGYSKDNQPDLKQFMISLIVSQDGDVPLLAQTIAGNSSDKKHFPSLIKRLKEQVKQCSTPFYYVVDSALYSQQAIQSISASTKWITRVPETVKEGKQLMESISQETMDCLEEGYYASEAKSNYGGVEQRWVIVFSQKRYDGGVKTVERQVKKAKLKAEKELAKLCKRAYNCQADALDGLSAFISQLAYHQCENILVKSEIKREKVGRPKPTDAGKQVYKLSCQLVADEQKIEKAKQNKGKFIIATNELDAALLSEKELVSRYKQQQSVERGFRFLKDPLFMRSSVYLKNESRIIALGMVMCLCLLVYMLAQRQLRLELKKHNQSIPNQKGKENERPTMRWVYQLFEGVHILYQTRAGTKGLEIVLNMNPLREKILQLLGPDYQKLYENAP